MEATQAILLYIVKTKEEAKRVNLSYSEKVVKIKNK